MGYERTRSHVWRSPGEHRIPMLIKVPSRLAYRRPRMRVIKRHQDGVQKSARAWFRVGECECEGEIAETALSRTRPQRFAAGRSLWSRSPLSWRCGEKSRAVHVTEGLLWLRAWTETC